ncbi:OOP family OmpA-OmpF porin [Catalinimonas alkaloidigena]|uniref:OmpA family protein n=1 Tax=Catalinimonas alkaloidigena TaxID=1075417 RepID=UPI002404B3E3|nr:OmpA family protein [Catalinimonas alkaloidigena]MDF9797451.1 OOP family OmpA-OmpF porin [Catalinimonas alkaloidigena]
MMLKNFYLYLVLMMYGLPQVNAQKVVEYELVNIGRDVNSTYHDSTPIVSPDGNTLYFTITNHPENTKGVEGSQDIWYAVKDSSGNWSKSIHMDKPFNKNRYNQVLSVSLDGNRLLIRGGNGSEDLGFSICEKENGIWQKPEALDIPDFENMCKGQFNGAFLSYDDKVLLLYFSERPKSKYSDLYISYNQGDMQWTRPALIKSLNTHMDEFGPYLAPDNKTLYFASNRGGGFGNMDVYEAQRLDDSWLKWSEPQNIGAPVNTSGFDAYYSVGLNDTLVFTTRAFMSADGGHLDIFSLKRIFKEEPKIRLEGFVMHKESWEPVQANIRYSKAGEVVGVLKSSPDNGEFGTALSDTAKYHLEVNAEGFFKYEDSVMVYGDIQSDTVFYKEIFLKPIEVGVSVRINNIFFDNNESTLSPESFPELDQIGEFLQENPKLEVEIAGHTDDKGTDEYNEKLSQGRAESVVKYLIDHWIDEQRVKAKGYGESKPKVPNDSDENRQINRRVEFTILKH